MNTPFLSSYTLEQFQVDIQRTWNKQTTEKDLQHCLLGLMSETGELLSAYKKEVGYNKPLDKVNVKEEIGDYLYFLFTLFRLTDYPVEEVEGDNTFYVKLINHYEKHKMETQLVVVTGLQVETSLMCDFVIREGLLLREKVNKIFTLIQFMCNVVLESNVVEVAETIINKLKKRFPDKFDSDKAINRNLEEERKSLENND